MSFIIEEDLLLHAAICKEIVEILDKVNMPMVLKKISLSSDTVSNRIYEANGVRPE
jgi:hypothetical protein